MWVLEPDILAAAIPALYGIEPTGLVGWTIHVAHGAVLGIVYGLLVTRPPILGILRTDVETTHSLEPVSSFARQPPDWSTASSSGRSCRCSFPAWIAAVCVSGAEAITSIAAGSLLGHLLFGTVLGTVFAATVDLHEKTAESPF